jgi:hypothetical protein
MTVFAAPIVTKEDERIEREALSEDEREMIRDEMYGDEKIMDETEAMVREGKVLLAEALETIPDAEKQVYIEALERAPQLVLSESDPARFLRCEKYDAWAAAVRLVNYWETRKKIFGSDRAFLPMTQTGAMAEDLEHLRKALILILPNDDHGRPVVYFDRVRCTSGFIPRDSMARCIFYVGQALCERESTQKGAVLVGNYRVSA